MDRISLEQAIARGWCHPDTSDRVMDPDLVKAIADEVEKALAENEL